MAQTFDCPHCSANYRALPTLVGRKVRCSSCKNVFQLQHTGIAIKVEVGGGNKQAPPPEKPKADHDAALERKPGAGADAVSNERKPIAQTQAAPEKPTRPQTRAIRRKTQRIQNMRSSLQEAAQQALQQDKEKSQSAEAKEQTDRIRRKSGPGQAPKRVTDSHVITHSGAVEQELKARRLLLTGCGGFIAFIVIVFFLLSGTTPQQQALIDFSKPIEEAYLEHPLRLDGYARRLWRPERVSGDRIPIILNIEHAVCEPVQRVEWPEIAAFFAKTIDDMVEYEHLPLWIHAADIEAVDKLWQPFDQKANSGAFLQALKKAGIAHYAMDEFSGLMLEQGFSKEAVYVCSMLLVPGLPEQSRDAIFNSDMPLEMLICEFNGEDGRRLLDTGAAYDIETLPAYHGLVVGFTGLHGHSQAEWRVLDMRLPRPMPYYYELGENPLLRYAGTKFDALRARLARENEFADDAPNGDYDLPGDSPPPQDPIDFEDGQ